MDLKGKTHKGWRRLIFSFVYAYTGVKHVIKHEQNMKIHLFIGVVVMTLAILLSVPLLHKMILLIVIGIILSLEVLNTAVERVVDLITDDFHPLAKLAKDVAAGAVFVFSIVAAIIGIMVFFQPFVEWMSNTF